MTSLSLESDFRSVKISLPVLASSAPVGSSAKMIFGSLMSAREDDLRVLDERPRDGDALLLPARKLRGAALLVHFEVDTLQILLQKRLVRLLPLQLQGDGKIFVHGELGQQVILLKDEPHIGIAVVVVVLFRKVLARLAVDNKLARGGIVEPAHHMKERTLSAAALPEDEHHARLAEIDGDAAKRHHGLGALGRVSLD